MYTHSQYTQRDTLTHVHMALLKRTQRVTASDAVMQREGGAVTQ